MAGCFRADHYSSGLIDALLFKACQKPRTVVKADHRVDIPLGEFRMRNRYVGARRNIRQAVDGRDPGYHFGFVYDDQFNCVTHDIF